MEDSAPATDNAPVQAVTEQTNTTTAETPVERKFEVPEAYREKGWAKNIKTEEDFWKSMDSAQSAMGKKYLPPDLEKMSDDDRAKYFDSVRPKDVTDYQFPEGTDDAEKAIYGKMLHDAGITKYQAAKLMDKFIENTNQYKAEAFSPEGLEKVLKSSFGEEYKEKAGELGRVLKSRISEDDWKIFDTSLTNAQQGLVFRIVDSLNQAYGAKEGDGATNSERSPVNVDAQLSELNKQMQSLVRAPHTIAQKAELQNKINSLHKMKGSK